MKSFIKRFARYHEDDKIKADEVGRACSTHERDDKCIQYFGSKP